MALFQEFLMYSYLFLGPAGPDGLQGPRGRLLFFHFPPHYTSSDTKGQLHLDLQAV